MWLSLFAANDTLEGAAEDGVVDEDAMEDEAEDVDAAFSFRVILPKKSRAEPKSTTEVKSDQRRIL